MKIYINNFNRLITTKQLLLDLSRLNVDMDNIEIIDNNSQYEPLIEWYEKECPCAVRRYNKNYGHTCMVTNIKDFNINNYYVYTDSDINLPDVPEDFFDILMECLNTFKNYTKVGPALRIDDIPDCFHRKAEVLGWENQFWQNKINFKIESYIAAIDTTFALYRPYAIPECSHAIRVAGQYVAKHCPWYYGNELPADEAFLRSIPNRPSGHWSR